MRNQTLETTRIASVTASTFDELVIAGQGRIVVEFMSYGCSHCRTLEPILHQVAGELAASTRILRVNVGLDQALANSYDIEVTPTLLMFLNGKEKERVEGPHPDLAGLISTINRPFAAALGPH